MRIKLAAFCKEISVRIVRPFMECRKMHTGALANAYWSIGLRMLERRPTLLHAFWKPPHPALGAYMAYKTYKTYTSHKTYKSY